MYQTAHSVAARSQIDFLILTALLEELEAVLAKLPKHQRVPALQNDVRVYYRAEVELDPGIGMVGKYSIIVLSFLGMGRVEAANATGDAIRQWNPRYILLIGIAGGIAKTKVRLGDLLIADQIVDYELQKLTPDGQEVRYTVHQVDPRLLGAAQHLKQGDWVKLVTVSRPHIGTSRTFFGPIVTGDKVVAFGAILDRYKSTWPKLIGVEMEAGGTVTAAFQSPHRPGFLMVRGVSDLADENKNSPKVTQWRRYASDIAASYAIGLLQSGPVPLNTSSRKFDPQLDAEESISRKKAIQKIRRLAVSIYGQILNRQNFELDSLQSMSTLCSEVASDEVSHSVVMFREQVLAFSDHTSTRKRATRRSTLMNHLARAYHSLMAACERDIHDPDIPSENIPGMTEAEGNPIEPVTRQPAKYAKNSVVTRSARGRSDWTSRPAPAQESGTYDVTRDALQTVLLQAHRHELISTEALNHMLERFDTFAGKLWDGSATTNESLTLHIIMITAIVDAFHELNRGKDRG